MKQKKKLIQKFQIKKKQQKRESKYVGEVHDLIKHLGHMIRAN